MVSNQEPLQPPQNNGPGSNRHLVGMQSILEMQEYLPYKLALEHMLADAAKEPHRRQQILAEAFRGLLLTVIPQEIARVTEWIRFHSRVRVLSNDHKAIVSALMHTLWEGYDRLLTLNDLNTLTDVDVEVIEPYLAVLVKHLPYSGYSLAIETRDRLRCSLRFWSPKKSAS